MLVKLDPGLHERRVVCKNGKKTVCNVALKVICGMLQSALSFYQQFRKDLENKDCEFDHHDPCVANKMIQGKQWTITLHVDDLKCSHVCKKANNLFEKLLDTKHGDNEIGRVKAIRGKHHDCLGMKLDFSTKGKLKVDMQHCMKDMLEDFSVKFKSTNTVLTPANKFLFSVDDGKAIDETQAEQHHIFVAKELFVSKRGRPDMQPVMAGLCAQVQESNEGGWTKLLKLMKCSNGTKELVLVSSTNNLKCIVWMQRLL